MNRTFIIITLAVVAASGCLDLDLLDEMELFDAGAATGEEGQEADDEPAGGDGAGGGGPPAADPEDDAPPAAVAPGCGGGERLVGQVCVAEGAASASFRVGTDEPARASLVVPGGGRGGALSEPWVTEHHLAAVAPGTSGEVAVTVEMEDVNGNVATLEVEVTLGDGPTISITEVLADPAGPEPAQEFVELANFGDGAVDLSGWMIDDGGDGDGDLLPDGTVLSPGEVGLVVSSGYDPQEGQDPAPADTARLIRVESSICSNGLKNSEAESVELYDATGALVSLYDGRVGTPVEGAGAVRLAAELPDGDALAFALDPGRGASPGTVPSLP
jgi:hypothetical protein